MQEPGNLQSGGNVAETVGDVEQDEHEGVLVAHHAQACFDAHGLCVSQVRAVKGMGVVDECCELGLALPNRDLHITLYE